MVHGEINRCTFTTFVRMHVLLRLLSWVTTPQSSSYFFPHIPMNKFLAALSSAAILGSSAFVSPAFSQGTGTGSTGAAAASVDLACMSAAIDVRESAIITARTNFHTKIMTALSTRREGLKAVFAIANNADRKVAIKTAWKVFAKAIADARVQYKVEVQAAWNVYTEASGKCKITPDRGGSNNDNDDDDDDDGKKNRGLHLGQLFNRVFRNEKKRKVDVKANAKAGARMDLSF